METYYKVLNENGTPCHGGSGKWNLPHAKRPGKWMPAIAKIKPCSRGYHLCRRKDLVLWLGAAIYEAEGQGEMVACDDKVVFQRARLLRKVSTWTERTARLFACDCADNAAHIYRKAYPQDNRVDYCIAIARKFANGEASKNELQAAGDAAWDARGAAWDAGDAAWAAWAAWAAGAAAWAARAAWDARGAAWAARAAWAAGGAAWAARAAWAAGDARGAAWDWQTERLFEYLNGNIQ